MKVTIIGGGNIGTQLAVHCSQENETYIYTSTPEVFVQNIQIVNENNEITLTGKNIIATKDAKTAFSSADYIFITYPAFMLDTIAQELSSYANPKMHIGIVPGTGGGECAFKDHLKHGATIFGLQRVPSVARLIEKGKKVRAVGYRNQLYVATLPSSKASEVATAVARFINIPCKAMPNYLNLTLTPSNPILHTTRLKTLFDGYHKGIFYNRVPLFYEEWDNKTSRLLFKCDEEVQNICAALKDFDLGYVKSLREHYESPTPEALTAKIRSIEGFKGLTSPTRKTPQGFIPDFESRYFTADFPYGLSILVQIGDFLGLDIPYMKETMDWYRKVTNNKHEYSFADYGVNNLQDFLTFYSA